jgi:hypothetical protein
MRGERLECRATFPAYDDAGNLYVLNYLVKMVESTDSSGTQWLEGDDIIATDDGTEVYRQAKGVYLLRGFTQDTILRSSDPGAV